MYILKYGESTYTFLYTQYALLESGAYVQGLREMFSIMFKLLMTKYWHSELFFSNTPENYKMDSYCYDVKNTFGNYRYMYVRKNEAHKDASYPNSYTVLEN